VIGVDVFSQSEDQVSLVKIFISSLYIVITIFNQIISKSNASTSLIGNEFSHDVGVATDVVTAPQPKPKPQQVIAPPSLDNILQRNFLFTLPLTYFKMLT